MPTPDTFTLPNINPIPRRKPHRGFFGPGNKYGRGRLKGGVNRITKDIKNGILTAAENLGRDGKGTDGFIGYLEYIGWNHPKAFAHLLGKMLPLQVNADVAAAVTTAINIISVPHDHCLSAEDIAKARGEPIEESMRIEPQPPIEPQPDVSVDPERLLHPPLETLPPYIEQQQPKPREESTGIDVEFGPARKLSWYDRHHR